MVVIRNFDSTKTQTVSVTTDIETNYGLLCNFVASLSSPPIYMSITGKTITVDVSLTTLANIGMQTISVVVDSADYPTSVVDAIYTFTLDVQHCVVSVMTIPAISNTSYSINSGVITFNFSAANWSNLACNYAVTYTATYVLNAASIT